jgi:hypothetical protein
VSWFFNVMAKLLRPCFMIDLKNMLICWLVRQKVLSLHRFSQKESVMGNRATNHLKIKTLEF